MHLLGTTSCQERNKFTYLLRTTSKISLIRRILYPTTLPLLNVSLATNSLSPGSVKSVRRNLNSWLCPWLTWLIRGRGNITISQRWVISIIKLLLNLYFRIWSTDGKCSNVILKWIFSQIWYIWYYENS